MERPSLRAQVIKLQLDDTADHQIAMTREIVGEFRSYLTEEGAPGLKEIGRVECEPQITPIRIPHRMPRDGLEQFGVGDAVVRESGGRCRAVQEVDGIIRLHPAPELGFFGVPIRVVQPSRREPSAVLRWREASLDRPCVQDIDHTPDVLKPERSHDGPGGEARIESERKIAHQLQSLEADSTIRLAASTKTIRGRCRSTSRSSTSP